MANEGRYIYPQIERVVFGEPAAEVVKREAERTGSAHVFLLASGTLNRETPVVAEIRGALGNVFAGLSDHMPAHTPREAVIEAANTAREAGADLIVTVGGGSVTDGGKVMQLCLEHGISDIDGLDRVVLGRGQRSEANLPKVRQFAVPTTLSGGEFSALAGCTDTRRKLKEGYHHPLLVPRVIVLDPRVTIHTPEWLWLSTGIRAVDHAVEGLCSPFANDFGDGPAIHALKLLSEALPRTKAAPADIAARQKCLLGVWHAMTASGASSMGASHGIGHVLGGTCDVPHGHTSCVMLPSVLAWNRSVNADRQALVSEAFGRPGEDAAAVVGDFIAGLGLPRTLAEVGVHEDRFALIAENAMHDRAVLANPRRIAGPQDVMEILRLAA